MVFGDLNDRESKMSPLAEKRARDALLEELGTEAEGFLSARERHSLAAIPTISPLSSGTQRPVAAAFRERAGVTWRRWRCIGMCAWGGFAWGYQLYRGIGVAGIRGPCSGASIWSISFSGSGFRMRARLISAILRLTEAGWRKPVTRAAEAITVFALMIGGMFPIIHLGRAWFFLLAGSLSQFAAVCGRTFRSPLMWDLTAISTYLIGSTIFSVFAADSRCGAIGASTRRDGGAGSIANCRSAGQAATANGMRSNVR